MKVKICGLGLRSDVTVVNDLKPDYMGFLIDFPGSARSVESTKLSELLDGVDIPLVYLCVNLSLEKILQIIQIRKPFAVQLHGDESLDFVSSLNEKIDGVEIWKALHLPVEKTSSCIDNYLNRIVELKKAGCHNIILDSSVKGQYGGTGISCDWDLAAQIIHQSDSSIFLAGGLTADNVSEAIAKTSPAGVDVSSGVEESKGKKDISKVTAFIRNAKAQV